MDDENFYPHSDTCVCPDCMDDWNAPRQWHRPHEADPDDRPVLNPDALDFGGIDPEAD